ncbi:MAG: AAA family ATPase [Firmicutes bacterium]|nr:AAA family ATPase [Bacillota bacterium]
MIQELLAPIREHFGQHPAVLAYLDRVQQDAVENSADFVPGEDDEHWWQAWERMRRQRELSRFRVNPFVTHEPEEGAPVLFEENPTFYNLFGRQAYRGDFGRMETDLTLLEAGALQRAEGGFLILPADALFASPGAWEGLRRFLQTGRVSIENLGEQYGALPTVALHPQPLSVDVKLILIGSGWFYRYLWYNDEVFRKSFGIRADFETEMERTAGHEAQIAGYIDRVARKETLLPVEDNAIAAIIEQLSRWASDQRKLSARLLLARQLLVEASAVAQQRQTTEEERHITDRDVEEALARIRYRQNALETRMDEMFRDGSYLIDVDGQVVGQINGLSILEDAGYAFGRPNRITARSYVGERGIVNIEREIELSGPIHSKGVGILQGYMTGTYGHDFPLIFGASLCFEQMYDEIDGDSASCAELCALLSSLAGIGLNQGIAVTGSVNQLGQVQPIGAVNEKIEGFFRVCEIRGLTGRQGVVIPGTNLSSLMLDRRVCEAVKDNRFHIWAVSHVDEILTVLTGMPAGSKEADGKFTPGSLHARVYDRLRQISQLARMDGREAERLRRHRSTSTPLQRFHRF